MVGLELFLCVLSCFSWFRLFAAPWTVARQAPLSMEFSRQEYWGGLLCPPPGDLPNPGIESVSFLSPAWWVGSLPPGKLMPPGKLRAHSEQLSTSGVGGGDGSGTIGEDHCYSPQGLLRLCLQLSSP